MKKILSTLIFLSFFCIGEAQENKFYLSLSGNLSYTKINLGATGTKLGDFQHTGDIGMGIFLTPKVRAEVTLHKRTKGKDNINVDYRDDHGISIPSLSTLGLELDSHAIMGKVFYRLWEGENENFIWLGIGIGKMYHKVNASLAGYSYQIHKENDTAWAIYLLGSAPIKKNIYLDFGLEFMQWKIYKEKVNNFGPRLGVRFVW